MAHTTAGLRHQLLQRLQAEAEEQAKEVAEAAEEKAKSAAEAQAKVEEAQAAEEAEADAEAKAKEDWLTKCASSGMDMDAAEELWNQSRQKAKE